MRIIRSSQYRQTPWKNGGGVTTEIIAAPEGAALDAFDWRISMARVANDGPFSIFPDIDRTLTVLTGRGLFLDLADRGVVRLDRSAAPYAFPGDIPVASRLIDGAIDDLNVMTRRGRFRHHVARQEISAPTAIARRGDALLVMIRGAAASTVAGGDSAALADGDTLMLDETSAASAIITPSAPALVFLIDLWRV